MMEVKKMIVVMTMVMMMMMMMMVMMMTMAPLISFPRRCFSRALRLALRSPLPDRLALEDGAKD